MYMCTTASGAAHAHAEHLRGRYEDALFDYRGPGGPHALDGMVDGMMGGAHYLKHPFAYGAGYAGHRGYPGRPVDWAKVCVHVCPTRKPYLLLLIACFCRLWEWLCVLQETPLSQAEPHLSPHR